MPKFAGWEGRKAVSMDENTLLIAKVRQGDMLARETLIEKNLGLVHHIVKRFIGRGVEAEDLFQIGSIGLMKAIDKFDLNYEGVLLPYYIEDIKANCSNNDYYEGIVSICEKLIKSIYSYIGYSIERNRILNLNAKSSYSRSTIKLGTILLSIAKSIGVSDTYGNDW